MDSLRLRSPISSLARSLPLPRFSVSQSAGSNEPRRFAREAFHRALAQHFSPESHGARPRGGGERRPSKLALLGSTNFFYSNSHSPFWELLLSRAATRAAAMNGIWETFFVSTHATQVKESGVHLPESLRVGLAQNRIHGLISVGIDHVTAHWIEAQKVPHVALFGPAFGAHAAMVAPHTEAELRMGVDILRAAGCEKLSLWAPLAPLRPKGKSLPGASTRTAIFERLLEDAGLRLRKELLFDLEYFAFEGQHTSESHKQQGFRLAHEAFSRPREFWPHGLLITDDMMAHGILTALRDLGVCPGVDVRVVTHSNVGSPVLHDAPGVLTLLEYDPADFVTMIFDLMENLLSGEGAPLHSKIAPRARQFGEF